MDYIIDVLNSALMYYFFIVGGVALIAIGVIMFLGIKYAGRIIILDYLFPKKNFDREDLKKRYIIQSIYTVLGGIALLVVVFVTSLTGVQIFVGLLIFGVLDGLYDYVAIKSA